MEEGEYKNHDIWKKFERNGDKATCSTCGKIILCKSSSTTGPHRHLTGVHKMKRKMQDDVTVAPITVKKISSSSRLTMHNFLNVKGKRNFEYIVSKLAAKDRISINAICNGEFIRNSIHIQGFH